MSTVAVFRPEKVRFTKRAEDKDGNLVSRCLECQKADEPHAVTTFVHYAGARPRKADHDRAKQHHRLEHQLGRYPNPSQES